MVTVDSVNVACDAPQEHALYHLDLPLVALCYSSSVALAAVHVPMRLRGLQNIAGIVVRLSHLECLFAELLPYTCKCRTWAQWAGIAQGQSQ